MRLGILKYVGMLAVAAAFAMLPSVASAQDPGPSGSYASGITCINLGTAETAVTVEFIRANGTPATSVTNPNFKTGEAYKLFTPDISTLDSGFLGSAVVSSGQEVACSVNTQTANGSAVSRVGTSNGLSASEIAPSIFATQIVNNLGTGPVSYDSYVAVQNAGDATTNVVAKYFDNTGAEVFSQSRSVAAKASTVFYQSDAQAQIGDGFVGSATFTSEDGTTPLAGAVAIYNKGTNATDAQFLSYNTFTSGAEKIFVPRLVKNLSGVGFTSGFSCQNVGPGDADMSMAISGIDQTNNDAPVNVTISKSGVKVGQSWGGFIGDTPELANVGAFLGSAVVTSTGGRAACTINEDNRTNFAGLGTTISGVADGAQSATMFFPQVIDLGSASFQGGFQVTNTTGNATTCTYSFSNDKSFTADLAANGSLSIFAPNVDIDNKGTFNASVEITCGEPIVGIYNLANLTSAGDTFAANNGINR